MSTATVKVNNYTNTTVKERKRKHLQPVSFGQIILPLDKLSCVFDPQPDLDNANVGMCYKCHSCPFVFNLRTGGFLLCLKCL